MSRRPAFPSRFLLPLCLGLLCASASPAQTPPGNGIRISTAPSPAATQLARAQLLLRDGQFDDAFRQYQQILAEQPRQRDALLALAVLRQHSGDSRQAAHFLERLLTEQPDDLEALARQVLLQADSDPEGGEARLRLALQAAPHAAALHFALGCLHARQRRWHEARAAFQAAHAGDSQNPDYLYNLAISLDQLHRPQEAASLYRQALHLAALRPAGFHTSEIGRRLAELQQ
ncbi:MAG: hypothetical protein RIR00_1708 [Pseudomonadota bacterium]|jgi:tetratricopeptide (TPR) repeat protein